MTCKVKIDAPHGIVEIEGDPEFVSSFYEKLAPLVDRAHFGVAVVRDAEGLDSSSKPDSEGHSPDSTSGDKSKKKRRVAQKPPAGSSCRDRILALKDESFFKDKRSCSDIVSGLEAKGFTHNVNQVGAALTPMFNKGEIQRTKDAGSWVYFWDRG